MHRHSIRWVLIAALAAVSVLASTGSAQATTPAATPDATAKANTKIFGSGSDATYYMNDALTQLYDESPGCRLIAVPPETQPLDFTCLPDIPGVTVHSENYDRDVVSNAPPTGASNGILQVCGNLAGVSFANDTRATKPTDCTGLHFVAFARDGIAWECFGTCHGVTNLTKAQLQGIYGDCSIHDWSQVGGSPGAITVYAVNPGSGVRSNFLSYLQLSTDATCTPDSAHVIQQNENAQIYANGDDSSAIFYFAISAWNYRIHGTDTSSIQSLEGIAPTEAHILDGTYPLSYFAYYTYCAASIGAAPCPKPAQKSITNFVGENGWICKASTNGDHKSKHTTDPLTGINYRTEVENTIRAQGFAPLAYGLTGGSVSGSSFCREFDG